MVFDPGFQVDWLGVLLAALAGMLVGWAWYQPKVFGNAWLRGLPMQMVPPTPRRMAIAMALQALGLLLMAYVTLHVMQAFMPDAWASLCGATETTCLENTADTMTPPVAAAMATVFLFLGYFVPVHLGNWSWKQHKWTTVLIDMGHHLVVLAVVTQILAAFL